MIPLADFHLKRGGGVGQRPLDDLSMAEHLVECLRMDEWPELAVVADFGITSSDHLGTLQHLVRHGVTAYDLDRVMGDGLAITQLAHSFGRPPYGPIVFETAYDHFVPKPTDV